MTRIDDARAAMSAATFILIGYGDGRGTEAVRGYEEMRARVFMDCGEDIDAAVWQDEWQWSDEKPSLPYSLSIPFESESLLILRLSDDAISKLADCADYRARIEVLEKENTRFSNLTIALLAGCEAMGEEMSNHAKARASEVLDDLATIPTPSPTDAPASDTRALATGQDSRLLLCPFCGRRNVAQGSSRGFISVWCNCGARGPEVPFPDTCDPVPRIQECYALWNKRHVSPIPDTDRKLARAVEAWDVYFAAYRQKYAKPSTAGIRDNAPLKRELGAVKEALNAYRNSKGE